MVAMYSDMLTIHQKQAQISYTPARQLSGVYHMLVQMLGIDQYQKPKVVQQTISPFPCTSACKLQTLRSQNTQVLLLTSLFSLTSKLNTVFMFTRQTTMQKRGQDLKVSQN